MQIFTEAGHLTEDGLILGALGDLEDRHTHRSERHLSRCSLCREERESIALSIRLFKTAARRQEVSVGL